MLVVFEEDKGRIDFEVAFTNQLDSGEEELSKNLKDKRNSGQDRSGMRSKVQIKLIHLQIEGEKTVQASE
jgi:hypothetical protein